MTVPFVPLVPVVPIRSQAISSDEYSGKVEAYHLSLNPMTVGLNASITEFNADVVTINANTAIAEAAAAFAQDSYELYMAQNMPVLIGTANGAVAIGVGSRTFNASSGKIWWAGLNVYARDTANAANWMVGTVTDYNPTTGVLQVNVLNINGSGSPSNWQIYPGGPRDLTSLRPVYELIGSIPTTSGTIWTYNPLPTQYADLYFEIAGISPTTGGGGAGDVATFQVEFYNGSAWSTPISLQNNIDTASVNNFAVHVRGYNLKVAHMQSSTVTNDSAVFITPNGVKGIRFRFSGTAAGDAGEIRAWGK